MRRAGALLALLLFVALPGLAVAAPPPDGAAANRGQGEVRADLDGRPLEPSRVAEFYCHDFDYPAIHCFRDPDDLQSQSAVQIAAASGEYVVVFDYTSFQGPYMYISQDYTALILLGWNDRVSSFMARNGLNGKFWTDWFYSGTSYQFCCNQGMTSLGSFNNSFSSVHRM